MITIKINGESREEKDGQTVLDLAQNLSLPKNGVAIAISGKIVKKNEWGTTILNDGDELTIVNAAYGGEEDEKGRMGQFPLSVYHA